MVGGNRPATPQAAVSGFSQSITRFELARNGFLIRAEEALRCAQGDGLKPSVSSAIYVTTNCVAPASTSFDTLPLAAVGGVSTISR